MRRREFIRLVGGAVAAWPIAASAQPTHLVPKVGWLKIQGPKHTPDQLQAFREGMRALGMIEGRDFVLEERYADGDEARLQALRRADWLRGERHIGNQSTLDRRSLAGNEKRAGDRTNGR
jgi:hypothetical protein